MNLGFEDMEVVYWEGGLLRHEVAAIEAMEKTFKGSEPSNRLSTAKGGMAQQLKALAAGTGGMEGVATGGGVAGRLKAVSI